MVTLFEITIEVLGLLLLMLEEIMFLLQVILVVKETDVVCLDCIFGLTLVRGNKFFVLSDLGERKSIMSSVQNSLSCHVLLGVLKDSWRRHVCVIAVQLLSSGGPHEIVVR